MKKKNILMIALSLCLIAIIAVGGTLAYFTDTTTQMTNVVTTGNVKIQLNDETVTNDPDLVGGTVTYEGGNSKNPQTGIEYSNIMPGDVVSKKVSVQKVDNTQDCYVAIRVDVADPQNPAVGTTTLDTAHKKTIMDQIKDAATKRDWKYQALGADGTSAVFYLDETFYTALADVNDTSVEAREKKYLFTDITIPGAEWGNEVVKASFVINVKAAAVQEANLDAPAVTGELANTALQQLLKNLDVTNADTSVMPAPVVPEG